MDDLIDAVVVGAGFGGIAALQAFRARGYRVLVVEAGSGPGGTWFWNRYPGARCDIDSLQYSFSFSPAVATNWTWSEKYSAQPEILSYLEYVVDQENMRPAFRFNTRIISAYYDEPAARWHLRTESGETITARFCVMATGTLSTANKPDFSGIEKFRGEIYHTGLWPHSGVDMTGKQVGVIGTGSSGVQLIPRAAEQAAHVTVLQRTGTYVVPAQNRLLTEAENQQAKSTYPELRRHWRAQPNAVGMKFSAQSAMAVDETTRHAVFEAAWEAGGGDFGVCFNDLTRNMESNAKASDYFRWKIAQVVDDPQTAQALTPKYQWGSRRLCVGTNYYETYNRANVTLLDLRRDPLEHFTASGVVVGGREYPLDMLIMATGFDAVTGTLLRIDIRGRQGLTLQDAWRDGPRTYLGMAISGFPNLFMISGAQSPGTLINMATGSEVNAEWIADCVAWIDKQGARAIEASPEAQSDWVRQTTEIAERSLMSKGESWWTGTNIPGKPRGYLGYLDWLGYDARCQSVALHEYEGFMLEAESLTVE
ncbi:Phenylacetone monooxygenase [Pseudomonas sp. 9AZ]|uniref:flavin-containing monooxygenase n=1 Tax=Pseudomonas sp. 9AZ TaxID=2653168 RepID=UPI0012F3B3F0|nr:NAD(P)/FAD-dependent oxidoreductase [Pseudomonas sp. 9AZ]VXD04451.1 Phenylacetone monooxygenase [Pseudomonas sp. 9AZ]